MHVYGSFRNKAAPKKTPTYCSPCSCDSGTTSLISCHPHMFRGWRVDYCCGQESVARFCQVSCPDYVTQEEIVQGPLSI